MSVCACVCEGEDHRSTVGSSPPLAVVPSVAAGEGGRVSCPPTGISSPAAAVDPHSVRPQQLQELNRLFAEAIAWRQQVGVHCVYAAVRAVPSHSAFAPSPTLSARSAPSRITVRGSRGASHVPSVNFLTAAGPSIGRIRLFSPSSKPSSGPQPTIHPP